MTTPERTWVDCAAVVREQHLLAMGDWALEAGLLDLKEVGDLIQWATGRRGVRRARLVYPWIRSGVESPQESRLRWILVSAGLPEPEINPTIVIRGQVVVRLDLAYQESKLAVEYDGDWHAETTEHDRQRRERLRSAGWEFVIVYKEDFKDPECIVNRVRELLLRSIHNRTQRW